MLSSMVLTDDHSHEQNVKTFCQNEADGAGRVCQLEALSGGALPESKGLTDQKTPSIQEGGSFIHF